MFGSVLEFLLSHSCYQSKSSMLCYLIRLIMSTMPMRLSKPRVIFSIFSWRTKRIILPGLKTRQNTVHDLLTTTTINNKKFNSLLYSFIFQRLFCLSFYVNILRCWPGPFTGHTPTIKEALGGMDHNIN